MITFIYDAEHYTLGDNCDGWHLLKSASLSVIQERMKSGPLELLHFHSVAKQLFFILSGSATFEVEGQVIGVAANQSIHVLQNQTSDL